MQTLRNPDGTTLIESSLIESSYGVTKQIGNVYIHAPISLDMLNSREIAKDYLYGTFYEKFKEKFKVTDEEFGMKSSKTIVMYGVKNYFEFSFYLKSTDYKIDTIFKLNLEMERVNIGGKSIFNDYIVITYKEDVQRFKLDELHQVTSYLNYIESNLN